MCLWRRCVSRTAARKLVTVAEWLMRCLGKAVGLLALVGSNPAGGVVGSETELPSLGIGKPPGFENQSPGELSVRLWRAALLR